MHIQLSKKALMSHFNQLNQFISIQACLTQQTNHLTKCIKMTVYWNSLGICLETQLNCTTVWLVIYLAKQEATESPLQCCTQATTIFQQLLSWIVPPERRCNIWNLSTSASSQWMWLRSLGLAAGTTWQVTRCSLKETDGSPKLALIHSSRKFRNTLISHYALQPLCSVQIRTDARGFSRLNAQHRQHEH